MNSKARIESKIVLIFILCTILIASAGCFALPEIKPAEETTVPVIDVELTVKCEQNLIFARYDVAIQVDGQKIGTVEHGTTKTYSLRLEEGRILLRCLG